MNRKLKVYYQPLGQQRRFPRAPVFVIAGICGACLGAFFGYEFGWPGVLLTFPVVVIMVMLLGLL